MSFIKSAFYRIWYRQKIHTSKWGSLMTLEKAFCSVMIRVPILPSIQCTFWSELMQSNLSHRLSCVAALRFILHNSWNVIWFFNFLKYPQGKMEELKGWPVRYVDENTTCELDTNYVIVFFIFVNDDIFINNFTHVASRTITKSSFICVFYIRKCF